MAAVPACWAARYRPFWFDEFFTLGIARQRSVRQIFDALSTGFEPNPPLSYLLVRFQLLLPFDEHVCARLHSIMSLVICIVAVYLFLRRTLPVLPAMAGASVILATPAMTYALDSRPYALILGFSAIAAACWQQLHRAPRFRHLLVFTISLISAVSSHYYSAVLLAVFGLAEAVLSVLKRSIAWGIWVGLLIAGASALAYSPWIHAATAVTSAMWRGVATFWAEPSLGTVAAAYVVFGWPVLPALSGLSLAHLLWGAASSRKLTCRSHLEVHELILVLSLCAYPLLTYAVGVFATGVFVLRYALPTVAGIAIATGLCLGRLPHPRATSAIVLTLTVFGFTARIVGRAQAEPEALAAIRATLVRSPRMDLPIAIADPLDFAQLSYYADPAVRNRLLYLTDKSAARTIPDFMPDLMLPRLAMFYHLELVPYVAFTRQRDAFFVFSSRSEAIQWLPARLKADGHQNTTIAEANGRSLNLMVRSKPPTGDSYGLVTR